MGVCRHVFVSTHAPLAGSDRVEHHLARLLVVSTHAPLAGSDANATENLPLSLSSFNPRSPCGERRWRSSRAFAGRAGFNPRSPCGERLAVTALDLGMSSFQPTLPLRGATSKSTDRPARFPFQPTLPLRGATAISSASPGSHWWFQPTLPLRGATTMPSPAPGTEPVSTHAPLAGSDLNCRPMRSAILVSTHAPLAGSDSSTPAIPTFWRSFNPRSPCGERPR